ncbi:hypothetical protein C0J52_27728 [Blattella germanica]|nr:hypothetical protein C0J52_27728 [Blattella germanica]
MQRMILQTKILEKRITYSISNQSTRYTTDSRSRVFQNSAPVEDHSQSVYEYTSETVPGNLCSKISNWSPVSLANNNKLPHKLFQDLVDAEIIDLLIEYSKTQ